ncbi:hypothetical protein FGO68_gene7130 [Halteria grandinella]|uniref:Uncharacterized protein n=1 Tax=Halteria grandinella TaxID=5974 RepID=A0A8J8SXL1_HALGN|nr:hypothetical protein FGO68_gene7130 [Halteria grandinella]
MDQLINNWFTFSEIVAINDNYETMGYESCNILQNLDTILLFLIGIIFMFILTPIIDHSLRVTNKEQVINYYDNYLDYERNLERSNKQSSSAPLLGYFQKAKLSLPFPLP